MHHTHMKVKVVIECNQHIVTSRRACAIMSENVPVFVLMCVCVCDRCGSNS